MKKIILNNKGQLVKKDKDFFGGKFSLLERIRMKGIGSIRVIYLQGISYFDELAFVENELSFANFELMKNGFLIRLNRNNRQRYVGFQMHELVSIRLEALGGVGRLFIGVLGMETLEFEVISQNISALDQFFQKGIFTGKYVQT